MEIIWLILAIVFFEVPVYVESGIVVSLSLLQYEVYPEDVEKPCTIQRFCQPKYQGIAIENSDEPTSKCPDISYIKTFEGSYVNTTTKDNARFTFSNSTKQVVFSYLNNLKYCIKLVGVSSVISNTLDIATFCRCVNYTGPEITDTYSFPKENIGQLVSISVKAMLNTSCEAHYFGWYCSIFCQPTDNVNGHYNCSEEGEKICHIDYSGVNCTEAIDDCENATCYNNGNCIDGIATYSCNCTESYFGDHCENKTDYCAIQASPCTGHGQCIDGETNYTCHCTEHYYGDRCQHHICEKIVCQNNGTCSSKGDCQCSSCYSGQYCGTYSDPCVKMSCHNGGSCVVLNCTPRCECSTSFTGNTCDTKMTSSTTRSTTTVSSTATSLSTSTSQITTKHITQHIHESTYSTTRLSRGTIQTTNTTIPIQMTTTPTSDIATSKIFEQESTYSTTRLSSSTDQTTNRTASAQKTTTPTSKTSVQATAKDNSRETTKDDKQPYIIAGAVLGGVVVIAVLAFVVVRIRKRRNESKSSVQAEDKEGHHNVSTLANGVDVSITQNNRKSQNSDTSHHDLSNRTSNTELQSNNNEDSSSNNRLSETSLSINNFNSIDEPFQYNERF